MDREAHAVPTDSPADARADSAPASPADSPPDSPANEAFAALPERWRIVLWHLEVMNESPAQVAPLLGMTPGGVATLAHRAREGLRKAYLERVPCGPRGDSSH